MTIQLSIIGLLMVVAVIIALLVLSTMNSDENYATNYYICDKCHHITTHPMTVTRIDCQYCGILKRQIKKA